MKTRTWPSIALSIALAAGMGLGACSPAKRGDGTPGKERIDPPRVERGTSEIVVIVSSDRVGDPARDRRCYYRVFINKEEAGRTGIGLESQRKTFRTTLDRNRHLVSIEKWVLDERKGRYEKLNNIDQPKPNFHYLTADADRIVIRFTVDHETRRAVVSTGKEE